MSFLGTHLRSSLYMESLRSSDTIEGATPSPTGPVFSQKIVNFENDANISSRGSIVLMVICSRCMYIAYLNGELIRWYPDENSVTSISFPAKSAVESRGIRDIFLDNKGYHGIITMSNGDSWYASLNSTKARLLNKFKGHYIECVSWNKSANETSTKEFLAGTNQGVILECLIDENSHAARSLFELPKPMAISSIVTEVYQPKHTETTYSRFIVFATANRYLFQFFGGPTLPLMFSRYGQLDMNAYLAFEAPRELSKPRLFIVKTAKEPTVLYWLSGAFLLSCNLISDPFDKLKSDISSVELLSRPPTIMYYPRTTEGPVSSPYESQLLPQPPPPPPHSMVITDCHFLFLFESKFVAVSRISYDTVFERTLLSNKLKSIRNLVRDAYDGSIWLYSNTHVYQINIQHEDVNSWELYLKKGYFKKALSSCRTPQQRDLVIRREAEYLCSLKKYRLAAPKFAMVTSVGFEDICLKFLYSGEDLALLEYLKCKLIQVTPNSAKPFALSSHNAVTEDETVLSSSLSRTTPQQIMLFIWIVELYVHNLSELEDLICNAQLNERETLSSSIEKWTDGPMSNGGSISPEMLEAQFNVLQQELSKLLQTYKDIDEVQVSVYSLLHSYGRSAEFLFYAEQRKDYAALIDYHMNHRDYATAIEILSKMEDSAARNRILYSFFPILFMHEAKAIVSLLLRFDFADVDASTFVPSLIQNCSDSPSHIDEAIRLLKHFAFLSIRLQERPKNEFYRDKEDADASPLLALGNMLDMATKENQNTLFRQKSTSLFGVVTDEYANLSRRGNDHFSELSVWRGMNGIWNCLLLLLADSSRANELMELLSSTTIESAHFDGPLILRVLEAKGCAKESVLLRGLMGMHSEAVEKAIDNGFLALAKQNASRPLDEALKKRLWLKIVEHLAEKENLAELMHLVHESGELIKIQDILPYMGDSTIIDAFKDKICETLDGCEQQIASKRLEIEDHHKAAALLKNELRDLNKRFVVLSSNQNCNVCSRLLYTEKFYAFCCGHSFHESCTKQLKFASLDSGALASYSSLIKQLEEMALKNNARAVKDIELRIDDIFADECLLCGNTMIEAVSKPFVGCVEEDEEAKSWAIM